MRQLYALCRDVITPSLLPGALNKCYHGDKMMPGANQQTNKARNSTSRWIAFKTSSLEHVVEVRLTVLYQLCAVVKSNGVGEVSGALRDAVAQGLDVGLLHARFEGHQHLRLVVRDEGRLQLEARHTAHVFDRFDGDLASFLKGRFVPDGERGGLWGFQFKWGRSTCSVSFSRATAFTCGARSENPINEKC